MEKSGTKQNMKCPTCQRSITVPEGGVNAIPQNLHLSFEVEMAGYISKIGSDGEKSCDSCIDGSAGPAVVFCCTCIELLCAFCYESHKRSRKLSNHPIIGLDKESLKLLPSLMKPTERLCFQPHHEKEELKFYCETCQFLVCRDCTLVLHKDHRIAEMCNIAKIHRDTMREVLVCVQEVTSQVTTAIDANDKMTEHVGTSKDNVTLIITQAFDQLYQAIEERKNTLLSEIGTISDSKTTAATLQKKQLMKMLYEIGRYTEMTSHILQTHTDHEVVALGYLLPTELKAILNKVENVSLTPQSHTDQEVVSLGRLSNQLKAILKKVKKVSLTPLHTNAFIKKFESVSKVKGMRDPSDLTKCEPPEKKVKTEETGSADLIGSLDAVNSSVRSMQSEPHQSLMETPETPAMVEDALADANEGGPPENEAKEEDDPVKDSSMNNIPFKSPQMKGRGRPPKNVANTGTAVQPPERDDNSTDTSMEEPKQKKGRPRGRPRKNPAGNSILLVMSNLLLFIYFSPLLNSNSRTSFHGKELRSETVVFTVYKHFPVCTQIFFFVTDMFHFLCICLAWEKK